MIQKLPIFPLNTVLFPGAPIQLHIFEERYRLMIGRCLEQSLPFGVVLIRTGGEISADDPWVRRKIEEAGGGAAELNALRNQLGGEAVPHVVGTTAQINVGESMRLDDGRYYLVAQGQRRFRIQYLVQRQPYLIASVALLPEEGAPASSEAGEQLRVLYARYWQLASLATGAAQPADQPPAEPVELSFWMAQRLQVASAEKQRWLEAELTARLRAMSAALRAELAMLPSAKPGQRERGPNEPGAWN